MMMLRARRTLKQDMVVVNKRGGGGAAAMNYFMTRPADGNTIMTFTVGHAITMSSGKTKLRVEDMAPIARGTNDPQILMVSCKASPYKTPEEFVAGMKKGDKLKVGEVILVVETAGELGVGREAHASKRLASAPRNSSAAPPGNSARSSAEKSSMRSISSPGGLSPSGKG